MWDFVEAFSSLGIGEGDVKKNVEKKKELSKCQKALNFRDISIIPTADDILREEPPELPVNRIQENYADLEEYLDTQFRLLHEDMVRPLVDIIQKYKSGHDNGFDGENVTIFENVKFTNSISCGQGMLLNMSFDPSKCVD